MKIFQRFRACIVDESGTTAIEYGLIAATMALMLIPAMQGIVDNTDGLYGSILTIFDHPMFDDGYFS